MKQKLLKFGHCLEWEEEGSRLAQIVWSTFLLRGELFEFFLQGYYKGIVHKFPAVHWIFIEQTYSIDIWNVNTHTAEKCSLGAQIS